MTAVIFQALAEMGKRHYLAIELCDYTLEEYVNITNLDHHRDSAATKRLAWQLLKGVRFLHEDVGIIHGNLKVRRGGDGVLQHTQDGFTMSVASRLHKGR